MKPMSDTNGKILQREPGMSSDAVMSIAKYPRLICEYRGVLTPDPWPIDGILREKMTKHIQTCDT